MATYSLEELTEQAGVTVRTVRYYIAEGLLPPPVGGGPRSAYTEGHLDRLRLITRLKDAYLPLREIRRRLAGLDDAAVRVALTQTETPAPTTGEAAALSSAADYIAQVRQEQAVGEPAPRRRDRAAPRADLRSPRRAGGPATMPPSAATEPAPKLAAPAEPAAWRRLPITDEAELLIREDAYQRRAEQLESLIAWMKRVLS